MKVIFNSKDIPTGLSRKGRKAAHVILEICGGGYYWDKSKLENLPAKHVDTGGCVPFYSPKQWKDRGEEWGNGAELVVCYDGGDMFDMLSYDAMFPSWREKLHEKLEELGLYFEDFNCWSMGIYVN